MQRPGASIKIAAFAAFVLSALLSQLRLTAQALPHQQSEATQPDASWPARGDTPDDLLKACSGYALDLDPAERAFLLYRIANAGATLQYSESADWARQAFTAASSLPKNWNRMALQKNALLALAKSRPLEALNLLRTVEGPDFAGGVRPGEDPRSDATREIFPAVYKAGGEESLRSIEEVSVFLAQTGEFPYMGWGALLPNLSADDPDAFREGLSLAIHSYGRAEDRFRGQDEDFLDMVDEVQNAAGAAEMKAAVETALDHLSSETVPQNETYSGTAGSGGARATFSNWKAEVLYEWLPLVKKFDPDRYKDAEAKVGAPAPDAKPAQASSEIIGDKGSISPAVRKLAADRLQAQLVINDAATNPDIALKEAAKTESLAIRADALAQAAANVPKDHAADQKRLLAASKSSLDRDETKDEAFLHALSDLTNSYYRLGMTGEALDGIRSGLELGLEVVNESADGHPGTPTMLLGGYSDLAQMVSVGMHLDARLVLRSVRGLRDGAVKANLMVDVAIALGTQQPGVPA